MIAYEKAIEEIINNVEPLVPVSLPIKNILGRGLAEAVIAPFDQPTFDNSSRDGYGVKVPDLVSASETQPVLLKLIDTIKAGTPKDQILQTGQAIKILTGAFVPAGAEAVIMQEYCQLKDGILSVKKPVAAGENIRYSGGEFKKGEQILSPGLRVNPPIIGLLASLGYSAFLVGDKPKVALIITGDELVAPGKPLEIGQIYDANSLSLLAALNALGIADVISYYVLDQYEQVESTFKIALEQADVIISSGGVSVGDFDFVKQALAKLGAQTVFWQIAVKPGRPVYFGKFKQSNHSPNKLIFGLPGNTVSVMVTFHQFVKPALLKMMLIDPKQSQKRAILTKNISKPPGRLDLVRANILFGETGQDNAMPTTGQDSHMLSGLTTADSLIHFPADETKMDAGELVAVDPISWWD